jgi:hypothetical protein
LNELWSDRLHFGQVLHCDLQTLDYDMGDMHTLTPQIKEGIEFQRGIIVKLKPRNLVSLETELISSVWTLEKTAC